MALKDQAKRVAAGAVALPKATVVGYWRGLRYPFRGLRFVFFEHPGLARFWLPPILVTLVLLVAVLIGGWSWHGDVTAWLWSGPSGDGFWASVLGALHWLLSGVVLLLMWALGLVAVVFSTNLVAAPFNDLLSEEVERLAAGRNGPPFSWKALARDSVRTVGVELVKLLLYVAVMLPMFLFSYVPVVGPVVYAVVGFLFTALYFAIDYVDWPASRRNRDVRFRFGMLRRRFWSMFGFGTGVWLFLFIPLVNLFFMPAAVAGGTLLFLDMEGEGTSDPQHAPADELDDSPPAG